jgi:hypothetical protein
MFKNEIGNRRTFIYICDYIGFVRAGKAAAARKILGRGNKKF